MPDSRPKQVQLSDFRQRSPGSGAHFTKISLAAGWSMVWEKHTQGDTLGSHGVAPGKMMAAEVRVVSGVTERCE